MYSIEGADGQVYGPVDIDQIVQWAREGRIVARTAVTDHDTGRRFLACDLAELDAVFKGPAVATPPAPQPLPVVDLDRVAPPSRWRKACPRCGGRHVIRMRGVDKPSFACCFCLFAPLMLPLVFFLPGTHYTCIDCGHEW